MKNTLKASMLIMMMGIGCVNAQTDIDAFNFSQRSIAGTARFVAMGGAFCATGADISTMSQNPAGIGLYRKGDITFSPSIFIGNTVSDYLGETIEDGRTGFNIGNTGAVFASDPKSGDAEGWVNWSFGLGYNRLYDFNNLKSFEGFNNTSSLTDYFAESSKGTSYENLDSYTNYLAYYSYLINPDSLNNYFSVAPGGNVLQRRSSETRGGINELSMTFAGNYMNRLYIGGAIAFTSIRYSEDTYFEEINSQNLLDSLTQFGALRQYTFGQYLDTEGSGVNLKLGLILRASDYVRVGAAIHTPTWYNMTDAYSNEIQAQYKSGARRGKNSPDGLFDYDFTSPFRATGGFTFLFEDKGLLSIDYEYTDFSQARFRAPLTSYSQVNSDIRRNYTSTNSLRAGAEIRIGQLSLRGGYGITTSPMSSGYKVSGNDFSQSRFSGGLGIRDKRFYLDLAYLYSITNGYYQPYYLENQTVEGVREKITGNNFTLTVGARF
ncbi:MAG: OmpP1/FadL family transporter [Bacteroidota bacterium]